MANTTAHEQARRLFFQSNLTQQQIADISGVHVRTVFDWINQGNWKRAKDMVLNAPTFLAEQYYAQLSALNNTIAARKDAPYPTKEESEIMRRVTGTLKTIKTKQTRSELVDTLADFSAFAADHSPAITELLTTIVGEYLELLSGNGPARRLSRLKEPRKAAEEHEQHVQEMLRFDDELRQEELSQAQPDPEAEQNIWQQRNQLQVALGMPPEVKPPVIYGIEWIDYFGQRGISPNELVEQMDYGFRPYWTKDKSRDVLPSDRLVEEMRIRQTQPLDIIKDIPLKKRTKVHSEVLELFRDFVYPGENDPVQSSQNIEDQQQQHPVS